MLEEDEGSSQGAMLERPAQEHPDKRKQGSIIAACCPQVQPPNSITLSPAPLPIRESETNLSNTG